MKCFDTILHSDELLLQKLDNLLIDVFKKLFHQSLLIQNHQENLHFEVFENSEKLLFQYGIIYSSITNQHFYAMPAYSEACFFRSISTEFISQNLDNSIASVIYVEELGIYLFNKLKFFLLL